VAAVIDGLVDGKEWWYSACRCHLSVTADSGSYYCKGCVRHAIHVVPRFISYSLSIAYLLLFLW